MNKQKNGYQINFVTNTVTVTRKFLEDASLIGTDAFNIMLQLRQMNLTIVVKTPAKKKNKALAIKV